MIMNIIDKIVEKTKIQHLPLAILALFLAKVINKNVKVQAAAVSHGSLSVRIQTLNTVSQPEPFSDGTTVEIQNAGIAVESDESAVLFEPGVDLKEVVSAVNAAGASTSSLIAILEALKRAGSLKAQLVVI